MRRDYPKDEEVVDNGSTYEKDEEFVAEENVEKLNDQAIETKSKLKENEIFNLEDELTNSNRISDSSSQFDGNMENEDEKSKENVFDIDNDNKNPVLDNDKE